MDTIGLTDDRPLVAFEIRTVDRFFAHRKVILTIQIDAAGNKENFFVRIIGKLFQHSSIESVLIFLVLPSGLAIGIVAAESILGFGSGSDQTHTDNGVGSLFTQSSEKIISILQNLGNGFCLIFVSGSEYIVDSQLNGDEVRSFSVVVFFKIAGQIKFAVKEEGACPVTGRNRSAGFDFGGILFGEKCVPGPAAVAFVFGK